MGQVSFEGPSAWRPVCAREQYYESVGDEGSYPSLTDTFTVKRRTGQHRVSVGRHSAVEERPDIREQPHAPQCPAVLHGHGERPLALKRLGLAQGSVRPDGPRSGLLTLDYTLPSGQYGTGNGSITLHGEGRRPAPRTSGCSRSARARLLVVAGRRLGTTRPATPSRTRASTDRPRGRPAGFDAVRRRAGTHGLTNSRVGPVEPSTTDQQSDTVHAPRRSDPDVGRLVGRGSRGKP